MLNVIKRTLLSFRNGLDFGTVCTKSGLDFSLSPRNCYTKWFDRVIKNVRGLCSMSKNQYPSVFALIADENVPIDRIAETNFNAG